MKSNRLFYIGLGCLISTLCWTIVMIAREQRDLSNLEINTLTCKEIRVLDKDGKIGILMSDYQYGDGGGSILQMSVKDNRIFKDGRPSQGELRISDRGLSITNSRGRRVLSAHVETDNGSFSVRKRDNSNLFYVDTENAKYSKTHCPCQLVE